MMSRGKMAIVCARSVQMYNTAQPTLVRWRWVSLQDRQTAEMESAWNYALAFQMAKMASTTLQSKQRYVSSARWEIRGRCKIQGSVLEVLGNTAGVLQSPGVALVV